MITYPSEINLPVQPAWDNPDLDGILTLQYFDGTTTYDALSGASGVAFDNANSLGTTGAKGEQVSATWISKPAGIDSDPYSLFETFEDSKDNYQLKVTFPQGTEKIAMTPTTNLSKDFALDFELSYETTALANPSVLVQGTATSGQHHIFFNGTTLRMGMQWATFTFTLPVTLPVTSGGPYNFKVRLVGGTLTAFLDGVAMTGSFTSVTQGFLLEDDELCTNTSSGIKIKHFKYISYDFPGDSRYWLFNKTSGTTVTDEINGQLLTLTNFTGDSGWERILPLISTSIGTGQDYTSFAAHRTGEKGKGNVLSEVIVTESQELPAEVRYFNGEFEQLCIRGATPFNGKLGDAGNISIRQSIGYTGNLFQHAQILEFRDIDFLTNTTRAVAHDTSSTLIATSCGFESDQMCIFPTNTVYITIKESQLKAPNDYCIQIAGGSGSLTLLDNHIIGNSEFGSLRIRGTGDSYLVNNVIETLSTKGIRDDTGNIKGLNNITNDASATTLGVGIQSDMTGWFTSDEQVTSTGRTGIGTSTGWNNSNILEWANEVSPPGDKIIQPGFISSTAVLYDPTVLGSTKIIPGFIDSTSQVFQPEVKKAKRITINTRIEGTTLYSPTVRQHKKITLETIGSTSQVFSPIVKMDQLIELERIESTSQVFAPIFKGEKFIEPGFIYSSAIVFVPTVTGGAPPAALPDSSVRDGIQWDSMNRL